MVKKTFEILSGIRPDTYNKSETFILPTSHHRITSHHRMHQFPPIFPSPTSRWRQGILILLLAAGQLLGCVRAGAQTTVTTNPPLSLAGPGTICVTGADSGTTYELQCSTPLRDLHRARLRHDRQQRHPLLPRRPHYQIAGAVPFHHPSLSTRSGAPVASIYNHLPHAHIPSLNAAQSRSSPYDDDRPATPVVWPRAYYTSAFFWVASAASHGYYS